MSRPGMIAGDAVGAGPVRQIFTQDGVFASAVFRVSGGSLYRDDVELGEVAGDGPVTIAGAADEVLTTAGAGLYKYDGTTFAVEAFPDDAGTTAVVFVSGFFVAIRAGSQKFYWRLRASDTWEALDFASAESLPDFLRDIVAVNGNIWLLGSRTVECWTLTGAADLPFTRIDQLLYEKGTLTTGAATSFDNALCWVGNDGIVYRSGDVPMRLSDNGIEERIKASATVSVFSFTLDGHALLAVRLDSGTWLYDASSQQWSRFTTHGRDNWRIACATQSDTTVLLGDDETGNVWTFGGWTDGDSPLVRLWTSAAGIDGGTVTVDNLQLDINIGWTTLLAGHGSEPVIETRSSNTAGATWRDWKPATMGAQGEYRRRSRYRRLGTFDAPGMMFEHRVSDPVAIRCTSIAYNEPGGGRSR